jgi:pimeloyl-ACP methyl ester carboxylesterase
MEFEHVTFDLPHGTFHALQGGDRVGQPTLVLHGFPDHPPTATPFLAELGRRGRHVVAPWLRGYAPSPTVGPFDLAALTSDVRSGSIKRCATAVGEGAMVVRFVHGLRAGVSS